MPKRDTMERRAYSFEIRANDTDNGTGIIPSFLLVPSVITVENLQELVDTGLYTMGADGYLQAN